MEIEDGRSARLLEEENGSAFLRPPGNEFTGWDQHGVKPSDTADAPDFLTFWRDELQPHLRKLGVTELHAHNSQFDEPVFNCSLAASAEPDGGWLARRRAKRKINAAGMNAEDERWQWRCSKELAKRVLPADVPSFGLRQLTEHFGGNLDDHHHAGADAWAAADLIRRLSLTDDVAAALGGEAGMPDDLRREVAELMGDGETPSCAALLRATFPADLSVEECRALGDAFDDGGTRDGR